jgi:asparagine synthase (glutamine-hydrolysing)
MCGIAGVMTRDGSAPPAGVLDRLERALAHRGPDGTGRLVRGAVGLVHLRLAIVDLRTGDQPLFGAGEDGTALIANGEIYNDPDLRRAMAGTPFRTLSDCEPAAFLYDRDGIAFADNLRGMYAIALHDRARNRLVLARDPFGSMLQRPRICSPSPPRPRPWCRPFRAAAAAWTGCAGRN